MSRFPDPMESDVADLQGELEQQLRAATVTALGDDYADADPLVTPAKDPKFGDYQANLAMGLAKRAKAKPRDLAEQIKAKIATGDLIESVEIAGPGFINLTLTQRTLAAHAAAMGDSPHLGVEPVDPPQTVVVDYSSPNVAKEMHIGHLRSTIIGDAIARVLRFQGHRVVPQNHVGDWGTQFGMLISYLVESIPADQLRTGNFEISDLNSFYQQAKQRFDADAEFAIRARQRVVKLQQGDAETVDLWKKLYAQSLVHFNEAYHRLGVTLTDEDVRGESAYNAALPDVVRELNDKGLLSESQGAKVVYPEGFKDRDDQPLPMIVQKGDGGFLYATTDLAAARHRIHELSADRIIYVTDARQSQHFAMVFQTLREAGWADEAVQLDHVPFGTIMGRDRKPFKTREGGTVRLADVLDEAIRRAGQQVAAKNPDLSDVQRQAVAEVIGIGAVKYADLSNDRIKDYVFDYDRMLALEGNTAPYLVNAYVRIQSIFRRGEVDPASLDGSKLQVADPAERALVKQLLQLPRIVDQVATHLEPHRLCNYLYELASLYHQFYERCPVLKSEGATRESRLVLCDLAAETLKQGLGLLGIGVVEQM